MVGLHAGAMYDVASNLFVNGQIRIPARLPDNFLRRREVELPANRPGHRHAALASRTAAATKQPLSLILGERVLASGVCRVNPPSPTGKLDRRLSSAGSWAGPAGRGRHPALRVSLDARRAPPAARCGCSRRDEYAVLAAVAARVVPATAPAPLADRRGARLRRQDRRAPGAFTLTSGASSAACCGCSRAAPSACWPPARRGPSREPSPAEQDARLEAWRTRGSRCCAAATRP